MPDSQKLNVSIPPFNHHGYAILPEEAGLKASGNRQTNPNHCNQTEPATSYTTRVMIHPKISACGTVDNHTALSDTPHRHRLGEAVLEQTSLVVI